MSIIRCEDGGWVRLDRLLELDPLWCHPSRKLDCWPLSNFRAREERRQQICYRLQLLFEGNVANQVYHERIRLQFLGIRMTQPHDPAAVVQDVQPFDRRMVNAAVQRQELRLCHGTQNLRDEDIELCQGWVMPWAVRATSGQTRHPEYAGMEVDPLKLALSISNALANSLRGVSTRHFRSLSSTSQSSTSLEQVVQ